MAKDYFDSKKYKDAQAVEIAESAARYNRWRDRMPVIVVITLTIIAPMLLLVWMNLKQSPSKEDLYFQKTEVVKHLQVISPYTGQVILFSEVRGEYGKLGDYLYWWDTNLLFHELYIPHGQIVRISTPRMPAPSR